MELKQRDRDRAQELQEVVTKQDLDQISTQENQARINQLEQLVQTVPVTYSFCGRILTRSRRCSRGPAGL